MSSHPPDSRAALPSVDEVLRHPALQAMVDVSRPRLLTFVRDEIARMREHVSKGSLFLARETMLGQVVAEVCAQCKVEARRSMQKVINATGVILHTNLGRAPLADRAVERITLAARYANLEWDQQAGERGRRGEHLEHLWRELTGAESALVVNNCAAATWLTLHVLACGRSVLVSRGQLVEIGGSYRLPDVFVAAGVQLVEVGTTNRTHLDDYRRGIDDRVAALLKVHQSNFEVTGFTASVGIAELVDLAHRADIPAIDDLGSGCLYDLSPWGLSEPTVSNSLQAGADLVLFSGDKLLGGPQAGIILGRRTLIEALRRHPLYRTVRIDKLTTAALEATLEIHLEGRAFDELPVLQAIGESAEGIRLRCERLLSSLRDRLGDHHCLSVRPTRSEMGGGSIPGRQLESWAIQMAMPTPNELARKLRHSPVPVAVRIHRDQVLLDLRTVLPDEEQLLLEQILRVLQNERM